jgi:amino acid transporter
MSNLLNKSGTMGTMPVFMTAISTILGAILFLKFGYAVGNVGLIGTLGIILVGHLVTIPTAMAMAEIATNKKVEGGGAYYMISRSFGYNIGAAIGVALFLSQAISVAFYVIAFAESLDPAIEFLKHKYTWFPDLSPDLTLKILGLVSMAILTVLMLTKGANIGVKVLYVVVAVLMIALICFFLGSRYSYPAASFTFKIENNDSFFEVFSIIFPAFTGIAAGLGLSGDLKNPKKSIPQGTLWAVIVGIVVYVAVTFKLFYSASTWDLVDENTMIMQKIAIWGPIIPIGLGCAAVSSALGSVIIAPRTLQAIGMDNIFPDKFNEVFAKGREKDNEPINASILTCIIAFIFVAWGNLEGVAKIISSFFMVTYCAICSISLLEHFAADPSYRPTFKSKWYLSLLGAVLCFYLMFKMDFGYTLFSIGIMVGIYFWVSNLKRGNRSALANLFKGVIFQLSRELQIFLQRRESDSKSENWRPFIVCVSKDTFKRTGALDLLSWLSRKYGFGSYLHFIEGFLNQENYEEAKKVKEKLVQLTTSLEGKNKVYVDTIISPSFTSAIAQVIQLTGVSGKSNNLILFEYSSQESDGLQEIIRNYNLLLATDFDVCILRSSERGFGYHKEIHIWLSSKDYENSNMMILLGYILMGHPEWKNTTIKIFSVYSEKYLDKKRERIEFLIKEGRLPISSKNIELIPQSEGKDIKQVIQDKSRDADLSIIGYRPKELMEQEALLFDGYDEMGNILFLNSFDRKTIQ